METRTVKFPLLDGRFSEKNEASLTVTMRRLPWEDEEGYCADRPETAPARGVISQLSDDRPAPRGAARIAMIKRELTRPVLRDDDPKEVR